VVDRKRCLEAGMNDHIAKPIDPEQLLIKLRRWVKPRPGSGTDAAPGNAAALRQPAHDADDPCWKALAQIDGLDSRLGLRRAAGREALYLSLLVKFVADQAAAPDRLAQAIARPDWDEAERTAHTLKGVAAQIGAQALSDAAQRLEQAIRERRPASELEPLRDSAARQLVPLNQALAACLPQTVPAGPAETVDAGQWPPLHARLLGLLEACDTECLQLFEQHAGQIRAALGPARYEVVAQAIRDFDFAAALAELQRQP
ncbi:MAG: Hpt domain-containing protein, partial [Burkholderiales bacterium]|nr:Hpt domain-containing protein [Burkholderiales bacterium]